MEKEISARLLIFARYPESGKVKTRLADTLGTAEALKVYKKLLLYTFQICQQYTGMVQICWAETLPEHPDFPLPTTFIQSVQKGSELGDRLMNAFVEHFHASAIPIMIIGADCPSLSVDILRTASDKLQKYDVVIGPAVDGGYYLLGMQHYFKAILADIPWSTSSVFPETMEKINHNKLSCFILPTLRDIDTISDYQYYYHFFAE